MEEGQRLGARGEGGRWDLRKEWWQPESPETEALRTPGVGVGAVGATQARGWDGMG